MDRGDLQQLKKVELHCHLDGSLSLGCVRELLGREVQKEELQVADDCRNLAEYLQKFDLPLECLQTEKGLEAGAYDFIKEVAKENVKYVETRFAPVLSKRQGLSSEQIIAAVIRGLERGKEEFGVSAQVITCVMRHRSKEENLEMLKAAREFLGHGVCAADLAGDEAAYPMNDFMDVFAEAKKMGFPFTLHAGECGSVENIKDSIACGAKRLGHGIAMRKNQEVQMLCREKKIGIEMCPISNQQTKAVSCLEEYPIREFLDAGLLVTLNTDNRMVSNTTITKEIEFVQKHFGVCDEEIIQMMRNAVEVSFATEEEKEKMRQWYR